MNFQISASTDVGLVKTVNQDSLFVRQFFLHDQEMVFAVLCDGIGGLSFGEIASAMIVRAFSSWVEDFSKEEMTLPFTMNEVVWQWKQVLQKKNEEIRAYGFANNCELGSTVVLMLFTKGSYCLMHLGDSRAYEISAKQVAQLTEDHTLAQQEVARGNLTPEEATWSPKQHILTKCVGLTPSIEPAVHFGEIKRGSVYILCSDGFRHRISTAEMLQTYMPAEALTIQQIKTKEEYLISLNKSRGETDNISVISVYCK